MTNFSADIGGSITRCQQTVGGHISQYESDFLVLPKDAHVIDDVADKLSTMEIEFNGSEYLLVKGESMNYYKQKPEVCDNNCLKADFLGTYLNAIYAVTREVILPNEFVRVDAKIGVCLPPAEVYSETKQRFIDTIAGVINVFAPLANARVTIEVDPSNVQVYPEGVVSVMAIRDAQVIRIIKQSSVLLVDIGYRSTDITLLRAGVPYRGIYASAPIGGINLEASLNAMLEQKGLYHNRDDLREILATGVMHNGTRSVEVGSLVQAVKQQFTPILREAISKVLNSSGMNMSAINYFAPIGRPFNSTGAASTGSDGASLTTMLSAALGVAPLEIENADVSNVMGIACMLNRGSKA